MTSRINLISLKERIASKPGLIGLSNDERDVIIAGLNLVEKWQNRHDEPPRVTAYLDPGYTLKRIDWIWAYLSSDKNGEGVCAGPIGNLGAVPLIAADNDRMRSLRPMAQHIAKAFGKPVTLAKFSQREDVEIITP